MQTSPGADNRSRLFTLRFQKAEHECSTSALGNAIQTGLCCERRRAAHLPIQTRCCCLKGCRCRPGPARCFRPAHRRGGSHRCGPASDWCLELQASSLPSFPGCLDILTRADGRTLVRLLLCQHLAVEQPQTPTFTKQFIWYRFIMTAMWFLLGFITRFFFRGSCKQLVFKFLFFRQRPFTQTQSDCLSKIFSWSDQKQEVPHSEKISQQYRGKSSSCHSSFSSTPSILRRASVVATDSWRSRLRRETGRLPTSAVDETFLLWYIRSQEEQSPGRTWWGTKFKLISHFVQWEKHRI